MTPPDTGSAPLRTAAPLPRTTGMDRIRIRGGKRLSGTLPISGERRSANRGIFLIRSRPSAFARQAVQARCGETSL